MKFFEHVDQIVGNRDRVVCGPQRSLTEEEMATFENRVYKRELTEDQKYFVTALCHLTQFALAHQEEGLKAIETAYGQTTTEWALWYTNDRHERLLGIHPAVISQ